MVANDRLTPDSPAPAKDISARESAKDSERRCLLTGEAMPRAGLIRLAVSPEGLVLPDLGGKFPGRGGWISADRALFDTVVGRNRLKGALARALKSQAFTLPDDLGPRIEAGLRQRLLGRLGLENRAGTLIFGADRVREQLAKGPNRKGGVRLLMHAGDARPDGADRLDGMARAVSESAGFDIPHRRLPIDRETLSAAVGRDNAVHMGVIEPGAASRILADLDRLTGFAPATIDDETTTTGPDDATTVAPAARERH
jgi:predicted RNA-binding protein YlxR (DUF448 family)